MQLICTSRYKPYDWTDRDKPPYAVVSHCDTIDTPWYEARTTEAVASLIRAACDYAKTHQLQWLWHDSCFSSKDQSINLNQRAAIYSQASLCIAYLDDVPQPATEQQVRSSSWFKDAFTLQDILVAPCIAFMTRDWRLYYLLDKLVCKDSMPQARLQVISSASSIPVEELCTPWSRVLPSISTASVMAWASMRASPREEDIAYALLGIFGLQMNVRYGEEQDAFIRLQKRVFKARADESVLDWKAHSNDTTMGMLAPNPKCFSHHRGHATSSKQLSKSFNEHCGNMVYHGKVERLLATFPRLGGATFYLVPLAGAYATQFLVIALAGEKVQHRISSQMFTSLTSRVVEDFRSVSEIKSLNIALRAEALPI